MSVGVAHRLHALGFHVFAVDHPGQPVCIGLHGPDTPCDGQRGKHPAVKWSTWAVSPTTQMIDAAWEKRGGLANVGIACGPSNLVALDEDAQGEVDRWAAAHGIVLPPTYTVNTGRGRHLIYRWNHQVQGRIGNSDKAMKGFKIDVRGDGGFVVGEGSQHASGAVYVGNGLPVTDLAQEVAAVLLAGAAEPASTQDSATARTFWDATAADPNTTKIPVGERHNALIAYASRMRKRGLDYQEAEAVYRQRWLLCEQPVGQVPEARFHSPDCTYPVTWEEAAAKLRDVFSRYPAGQVLDVEPVVPDDLAAAIIDHTFWQRRAVLQHIELYAKARRVPPWAMFGAVAVRTAARIPPYVVLPALVGSTSSLNFYAAIVGPPGAGKDTSDDAAGDAFTWGVPANPAAHFFAKEPVVAPLGTGEGIARTFRPIGTKPDEPNPVTAAIFSTSEIDQWAALDGRTGSTLTPTLRMIFSGKAFGFANAGKDTRVIVARDTYRACLFVGVQPLKSGPLLNAADGGLPQRFVWFPTSDVDAPEIAPHAPKALPDPSPDWTTAGDVDRTEISEDEVCVVLRVPSAAKAEIDQHRRSVLRCEPDIDPLDGHALITRLKMAAVLMALDSRTSITDDDWSLAGTVMEVSRITRDACARAIADQAKRANRARAHDQGEREAIVSDKLTDRAQKRVVKAICSKLRRVGRASRRDLRAACTDSIRGEFSGVFDLMLDQGVIVPCESEGNQFSPMFEFGSEYEGVAHGPG